MGRRAPRDPPRRAAAGAPGWPVPVHARRDVRRRPRPDRVRGPLRPDEGQAGGVRDLLELRRGRAPLGLERADTLEALRKLDEQFGRIDRAIRYAPRPYHVVVLSDHGQTQGATFKQRNGYGFDELVDRSLEASEVTDLMGGDEQHAMVARRRRGDRDLDRREEGGEERRVGARSSSSAPGTSGSST